MIESSPPVISVVPSEEKVNEIGHSCGRHRAISFLVSIVNACTMLL
jgi:hypothetical protein